jgi:hypothetical protein
MPAVDFFHAEQLQGVHGAEVQRCAPAARAANRAGAPTPAARDGWWT